MAQLVRDAAFLDKCEQFLLHPAVRALSLAQRVDFLEQKARCGLQVPPFSTTSKGNLRH